MENLKKIVLLLLLMPLLTACPGEEDCDDMYNIAREAGLITLTPFHDTYQQGDVVTLKLDVASATSINGAAINFYEATLDPQALLILSSVDLFRGNQLTFIKGSQAGAENWFNVGYNPETQRYELEIAVKLNKQGNYVIHTGDYLEFKGRSDCNRYRLDTNIAGAGESMTIEFNVE